MINAAALPIKRNVTEARGPNATLGLLKMAGLFTVYQLVPSYELFPRAV